MKASNLALAQDLDEGRALTISRQTWGHETKALEHAAKKQRRDGHVKDLAEATKFAHLRLAECDRKWPIIYTDPAWPSFETYSDKGKDMASADNRYPPMTLDKIKAMKIPAAKNCVVFMWITIPYLDLIREVMEAWGFTYKSATFWHKESSPGKPQRGTGYWHPNEVEVLAEGTRGKPIAPLQGEQMPQWFSAPRGRRHSEKPEFVAEEIDRLYPNVPKLEMFAREVKVSRGGEWTYWGNEIPGGMTTVTETLSPASNVAPVSPKLEASVKELFLRQAQKPISKTRPATRKIGK